MLTKQQSLENFKQRVYDLTSCRYIMADSKVGEILRAIASSKILYELFEYVTSNFDYATVKSVCFLEPTESAQGSFALPNKDEDILAFVFLLLMEIDGKKVDILSVTEKYFYDEDGKQASYNRFIENMIIPFAQITEKTVNKLINGDFEEPKNNFETVKKQVQTARKGDRNMQSPLVDRINSRQGERDREKRNFECAHENQPHPNASQIEQIIDDQRQIILSSKLKGGIRDEALFVLDVLEGSLDKNDGEAITTAYVAYKYIAMSVKKPKLSAQKMGELIVGD